jgi:nucleotide-binding universal stress UspA family protein
MKRKLHLLVAVDFSDASTRALRAAAGLAKRVGSRTTIAHVRPSSDLKAAISEDRGDLVRLSPQALRKGLAKHYRERLEKARGEISGARAILLSGWPAEAIARAAGRRYDMIVIGSRGRGGVRTALLGSTAEEVLHRARIPVLVVESNSRPRR